MISIDEVQQRVLALLEEYWEQEFVTLLNTALDDRQGRPEELALFGEALEGLIGRGLVLMAPERERGKTLVEVGAEESLKMLAEGLSPLYFGEDDLHWTMDPFVYRYVVPTEAGIALATKILDERGYQWWYHEDEGGTV